MEDDRIIELFFERDERAVAELQRKYFPFCLRIAVNLLSDERDAEECVNDTFLQAWNSIPPERPQNLRAWLGKVVRLKSYNLWQKAHSQKRYNGMTEVLDELEESIPSHENVSLEVEAAMVDSAVDRWLRSLSKLERWAFLRRYCYGVSLKELAKEMGTSPYKLAQQMYRLRQSLKKYLEREDQLYE